MGPTGQYSTQVPGTGGQPNYTPASGYGTQANGYYYTQNSPNGGSWSSTPATQVPGGGVLGAATSNVGGGNGGGNGGGGGGGAPQQSYADANHQWNANGQNFTNKNDYLNYVQSLQGVNPGDVDNAYNEANGYYDKLYSDTNAGKQNYLDQYTNLYDSQKPALDTAYQQGSNLNQQQMDQTYQGQNNAIDSARNLYNELNQGVKQRFGSSNSAGDFANAFYGRQFQQNLGNVQNTTGQNINGLLTQHANLLNQYQANMQTLNGQKASALAGAQDTFQQRLDAINQARGQMSQNKAQMKLSALQDYRNTVNGFLSQAQQAQNSVYANHLNAADQLKNTIAAYATLSGKPIPLSVYNPAQFSQMGGGQTQGQNTAMNITGQMGAPRYDQNGNPIG